MNDFHYFCIVNISFLFEFHCAVCFLVYETSQMKNNITIIPLIAALTSLVHGQTSIIDFNSDELGNPITAGNGQSGSGYDYENLQPYANIYGNNQGVTFSSALALTVYNTNVGNAGRDQDLQPSYEGGNNSSKFSFGNALIMQEAGVSIDSPDDEGRGGSYTMTSDLALRAVAFDILDVDDAKNATLTFTSSTGVSVSVDLELFEDRSGDANFETEDVEFGNRHSNHIAISVDDLESHNTGNSAITDITEITYTTTTSGGLGQIELTVVPEPSSSLLVGVGFITFAFRRRR